MIFDDYLRQTNEVGYVDEVVHPLVYASGLPGIRPEELVMFESGEYGQVLSLAPDIVEILTFSKGPVRVGTKIARTRKSPQVFVSENMLGRTVDAFGASIYPAKPIDHSSAQKRNIHNRIPNIDERKEIRRPLETGVAIVDLMLPLGKGQRELVLGDRKIGKTNFLLQTVLSQARKGSICVYAAIGKTKLDVRKVEAFLEKNKVRGRTVVVASAVSESFGLIHITPYSAMTIAEYFRDLGNDVLLILDDMTTHARFYRELSLLARKFPGRASYPGDIFYIHARLLERAGNFKKDNDNSDVAITCLPVAETVEGEISGYIQTNLMSITDGHLFFDKDLFVKARRPAINYSLSVSRVGRQTQSSVRWGINRELNSFLTLYEKTQNFIHFGAELNENIRSTITMGERILAFFNQAMHQVMDINIQIFLLCLIWTGLWTSKKIEDMEKDLVLLIKKYESDADYREKINRLVNSAKDFNSLLGKVAEDKSLNQYK